MVRPIKFLTALLRTTSADARRAEGRRSAEEELILSEERLRLATEAGNVGMWDWDIVANRVTWTRSLYAMHGVEPGELGGAVEDFIALTHPDDREPVQLAMRRALAGEAPYEIEFRALRPDGQVAWLYTNGHVVFDRGRAVRMVGATVNIDARKRTELALRESEERLRLALRAANAGVWEWDVRAGQTFWSEEFLALYGFDSTTPRSYHRWLDALHPEDRERMRIEFPRLLHPAGGEFRSEFRIIHPLLGVRWILSLGRIERDAEGGAVHVEGINIDITRLKQVEEELREANQRKNEFLATLAHELRNPLAPIRNGLEILRLTHSGGESAERAREMMDRQLKQMVRLIDDLLDLSRISRGKIELKREPIDLATALQSALEMSQPLIDGAGHELTIEAPPEVLLVNADLTRLAQVFGNLLNNAAKYTNPGGRIWLTVRRTGREAIVSVRDNGVGVAAAMLPKIFDMFAQVDHSLQRAQGGLGIGLSIARKLVEMHGGALEAHSAGVGAGSEFVVRLPLLDIASPVEQPQTRTPGGSGKPGLRILIADDNADAAASLAVVLRMKGHDVRIARDGLEALDIAARFHPQATLLDIGMPHADGYEVCQRLRAQPGGSDQLIVALTGWGQADDRRRSEEAGFDRHLVKPADVRAIEELLERASTKREAAGAQ
jgi:PAS domain S-box-containing protein